MRGPDGKVVRAQYVLTDGTVDVGGRVVAQDERKGIVLRRIDGPLRQVSRVDGPLPAGHLVGPLRPVHAARLPRRRGRGQLQSDPSLFTKPTTVVATVDEREVARTTVAPTATEQLRVPLTRHGESCVVGFTVSPTAIPRDVTNGAEPRPARARRALLAVHLPAVRIAFDVSPLSHPRTGVGNYIRGSLARGRRGGGRRARGDPVRADARRRASGGSRRSSRASRSSRACASSRSPTSGARAGAAPAGRRSSASSARSTSCTSPTGCTRPSAAGSARR